MRCQACRFVLNISLSRRFAYKLLTNLQPFPILLFTIYGRLTWCRDLVQLLVFLVRQFAVPFHTFLRIALHVVRPSDM